MKTLTTTLCLLLVVTLTAQTARATCFCMLMPPVPRSRTGSSITEDKAYNPAAAVFLLRNGTRTVMTIEAAYRGPSREISMVIPVPSGVERGDVRTVSGTVFRRLDLRTAPKVQHVWPACDRLRRRGRSMDMAPAAASEGAGGFGGAEPTPEQLGIDIEDEWAVEEYDVTTLGAAESTGLLTFLRMRGLELSAEAEPVLQSYIQSGMRFVLVKADPARAHRVGEDMVLSPIQLDFESEELRVPVRLGTLNSPGMQELLLYVLSPEGRFEIANRPTANAPTDLQISPSYRGGVAGLYAGLMDEVFRQRPGAGVTEFARDLGRGVSRWHVRELGLDRVEEGQIVTRHGRGAPRSATQYTLTRIRHRYGTNLSDDLVLRAASTPLRLERRWRMGQLDERARAGRNNFHTRFVVVHRGAMCPSEQQQRQRARHFATSSEMWGGEAAVWPGEALMDPIDSLGILPGSTRPAAAAMPAPSGAVQALAEGAPRAAGAGGAGGAGDTAAVGAPIPMPIAPVPTPPAVQPAAGASMAAGASAGAPPAASSEGSGFGCSAARGRAGVPLALFVLVAAGVGARRRRRRQLDS